MLSNEQILKKWQPLLESDAFPKIEHRLKRDVTALCLENMENELKATPFGFQMNSLLSETAPTNSGVGLGTSGPSGGTAVAAYDPILINLVRRAMPNLMVYDFCGVQPMTGPTGLVFAMRSRYTSNSGTEAFYNEANTLFSTVRAANASIGEDHRGGNSTVIVSGNSATYDFAGGMTTTQLEALGSTSNVAFAEMALSIEKVQVTAAGRALRAQYSVELAQDLKALHSLDAETELANMLAAEILSDINREIVRTVNLTAVPGSQVNVVTAGTFDLDTDSNGRWFNEKHKGLMLQIEFECNKIAKDTRRGKGNFIICSSNVASALKMAGMMTYTPALNANLQLAVDDTGVTFAGVLNGSIRVYIDPYSSGDYLTVGYRGSNNWDAGLFYCPYVPLQMYRAIGQDTYQPSIAFKTRYGMVANPFAQGTTQGLGAITQNSNLYFRRSLVGNLF